MYLSYIIFSTVILLQCCVNLFLIESAVTELMESKTIA